VIVSEYAQKDIMLMKNPEPVDHVMTNVKLVLVVLNIVVIPVQMDLISIMTNVSIHVHMVIMKILLTTHVPLVTKLVVTVTEDNPINVLNVVKEPTY